MNFLVRDQKLYGEVALATLVEEALILLVRDCVVNDVPRGSKGRIRSLHEGLCGVSSLLVIFL